MKFTRLAIYFMPAPGAFSEFADRWLGWSARRGVTVAHPEIAGLPHPVAALTERPRKYGFHATLKAPFRLADGESLAGLRDALQAFAATRPVAQAPGLRLARIGAFLALMPNDDSGEIDALAADVVEAFDPFRAPLTDADRARRLASGLSAVQIANLDRWGYPYVMDEFRFHMTLTGPLPEAEGAQVLAALTPWMKPLLPTPFVVDALTLAGEDVSGQFHAIERVTLAGKVTAE
ncbi:MAG: DUF1045 domain-containing protein [Pseudomonadota bacterium]